MRDASYPLDHTGPLYGLLRTVSKSPDRLALPWTIQRAPESILDSLWLFLDTKSLWVRFLWLVSSLPSLPSLPWPHLLLCWQSRGQQLLRQWTQRIKTRHSFWDHFFLLCIAMSCLSASKTQDQQVIPCLSRHIFAGLTWCCFKHTVAQRMSLGKKPHIPDICQSSPSSFVDVNYQCANVAQFDRLLS